MNNINRRKFIQKSAVLGGLSLTSSNIIVKMGSMSLSTTTFMASYDTESKACLENLEMIVDVHKKHNVPATFFIVSNILNESNKHIVRNLLNDPLFEIASHSYSHRVVLDHPICGKAQDAKREIVDSKKILEDIFGKELLGFRTPCGYPDGLRNEGQLLDLIDNAGYKYISTQLWGPGFSLPADIIESFSYKTEGYDHIWEIPGHGWHENVLKGHTKVNIPLVVWPTKWPEAAIPKQYLKTPNEEFNINRFFLDTAMKENKEHITFIWHPWSLGRFDKEMKMLDFTFSYIKKVGLKTSTFESFYNILKNK